MSAFSDAYGLYRFAVGVRAFLRYPISPEEARAIVKRGMQRREAALLEKLEGAVFRNSRSPYLALFRNAGCTWDDAREAVEKEAARHVVEDGETGLLFRKGDVDHLTIQTLRAAADAPLRSHIGGTARQRVTVHSLDDVAAAYAATIEHVLGNDCGSA